MQDAEWADKKQVLQALDDLMQKHGENIPLTELQATLKSYFPKSSVERLENSEDIKVLKALIEKYRQEYLY